MTRIVLVGGGHAHLESLANLGEFVRAGHDVTVVSPRDFHYYSGMGPGLLGGTYRAQDARFDIRGLTERAGATFVRDRVLRVDPHDRLLHLAGQTALPYDVASFNVGSAVPLRGLASADQPELYTVKPVERTIALREAASARADRGAACRLAVIGGGSAGVEVAGNFDKLCRDRGLAGQVTLVAGRRLLGRAPRRARQVALASLQRRGVTVLEGCFAERVHAGLVRLNDGRSVDYDVLAVAVGVRPPELFAQSGLPVDDQGALRVNAFLQCAGRPEIFGAGDCIHFDPHPLDKVGVYAVRQAPVLKTNLLRFASGKALKRFAPQKGYLQILNLGDGRGLAWRGGLVFGGRPAFRLKDWIDRRFMRRYRLDRLRTC